MLELPQRGRADGRQAQSGLIRDFLYGPARDGHEHVFNMICAKTVTVNALPRNRPSRERVRYTLLGLAIAQATFVIRPGGESVGGFRAGVPGGHSVRLTVDRATFAAYTEVLAEAASMVGLTH